MAKRAPRTGTPRSTTMTLRLRTEQRQAIEDAAHAAGMTPSAFGIAMIERGMDGRAMRGLAKAVYGSSAAHEPANDVIGGSGQADAAAQQTPSEGPHDGPRWVRAADAADIIRPRPSGVGPTARPSRAISLSDPAALYELRRIGNNLNQLAHAANSGLPPSAKQAAKTFAELFELLADEDAFYRRLAGIRTRTDFHGAASPQAGKELQGRHALRPPRPRSVD